MKREIINYPEFLSAIDDLFSQASVRDVATYAQNMSASKQHRKKELPLLSEKLRRLKADIEKYKAQIRTAQNADDKKKLGILLNKLLATKTALLQTYKAQKNHTPFSDLSDEAKTYACTLSLMKKYLLEAFVKSSPQAACLNNDGTVSLNVDYFLNSVLYQQVRHIKDYIASYIEHYPSRVNGSRYFVGLHQEAQNFDTILDIADEYFEQINIQNEKDMEAVVKSHQGLEVIAIYPRHNVQAVRLLTKEALAYEGNKMNHCVATYSSAIEKGKTTIYSIRDYGDEQTEFVPHATIEYKDGKIKQIKGYRDGFVDCDYIEETRQFLMSLLHVDDIKAIMNNKDIPMTEQNNIGFITDTNGYIYDLLDPSSIPNDATVAHLNIKSHRIKAVPLHAINLGSLTVYGSLHPQTIRHLATAKSIKMLTLNVDCNNELLDFSALTCNDLHLILSKASPVQRMILPQHLKSLTIEGDMNQLSSIEQGSSLQLLKLKGQFNLLASIPQDIKESAISGEFPLLKLPTSLTKISVSGMYPHLSDSSFSPSLKEISLNEGTFENLRHLDFSSFENLTRIDLANSRFPNLEELKIPHGIRNFSGAHCIYPKLKRIDLSHAPLKSFNILEQIGEVDFGNSLPDTFQVHIPIIYGYLMSFSQLPQVEEIKLREDIEIICLHGMSFGENMPLDFAAYPHLKQIDFTYGHFSPDKEIDLSHNAELKKIGCDFDILSQIILPSQIKGLYLRKSKDAPVPQTLNLPEHIRPKTLKLDFFPQDGYIPSYVEQLQLSLFDASYPDLKVLDLSSFKHAEIKTSSSATFSNLKRLVLSESFFPLLFHQYIPHLTEIDFGKTKGLTTLRAVSPHGDGAIKVENNVLYLHPQQFDVIEKIIIGKDTELELPAKVENSPIKIELSAEVTAEKERRLKERYPNLTIGRVPVQQQRLFPSLLQKTK